MKELIHFILFLRTEGKVEHLSVNACLAPAVSMHGMAVTTIEVNIGGGF